MCEDERGFVQESLHNSGDLPTYANLSIPVAGTLAFQKFWHPDWYRDIESYSECIIMYMYLDMIPGYLDKHVEVPFRFCSMAGS